MPPSAPKLFLHLAADKLAAKTVLREAVEAAFLTTFGHERSLRQLVGDLIHRQSIIIPRFNVRNYATRRGVFETNAKVKGRICSRLHHRSHVAACLWKCRALPPVLLQNSSTTSSVVAAEATSYQLLSITRQCATGAAMHEVVDHITVTSNYRHTLLEWDLISKAQQDDKRWTGSFPGVLLRVGSALSCNHSFEGLIKRSGQAVTLEVFC